jgi:allophanate hydrolase subunit 2
VISVDSWGIAGSVVDAGRPGRAWLGAGRGGAVDLSSLALGNRLVGNAEHLGAFETSGGLTFTVDAAVMVAVVGAVAKVEVVGGPAVGWGSPVVLPAGASVRVARLLDGARSYVAVRGGLSVDAAGSVSVGPDPGSPAAEHAAPRHPPRTELRVWPGPRLDWFRPDAFDRLCSAPFTVTATSRVGTRLSGPTLHRARDGELPSEGMIEGAIQVPPDGDPIVFLADHPTTGGYPVIAVLDPDDLPHLAQATPGSQVRFRPSRRT